MPRKTRVDHERAAFKAGYQTCAMDLIDRRAVSFKYADLKLIMEMVEIAGDTQFNVWKEEQELGKGNYSQPGVPEA